MSNIRQKILLLLASGVALGYSYSPNQQWKVLKSAAWTWKEINRKELKKKISELYRSKMLSIEENSDDTYTVTLSKKGKLKALTYHFEKMRIKRIDWDGKWRIVIFDIPEKIKTGRDALRRKLKELGFYELQKSVFVFPYECEDEIEFVIEFFDLRKYVRFGVLESVDNELHLKKIFELL